MQVPFGHLTHENETLMRLKMFNDKWQGLSLIIIPGMQVCLKC